jgi:hypothetical protein
VTNTFSLGISNGHKKVYNKGSRCRQHKLFFVTDGDKNKLERLFLTKFFKLLEHLQFKDMILSVVWSTIWRSMSPGPGAITPSISSLSISILSLVTFRTTKKLDIQHNDTQQNDNFVMLSVIYAGCQK